MMIEAAKLRYDLVVVSPSGEQIHLEPFLTGLEWEEQPEELAVRLTAEIQNVQTKTGWLHKQFPIGGKVFLFSDWGEGFREIFRGTIFKVEYRTDPLGNFTVTAYDPLIYLARSQDDRVYKSGTKGKTIIEDIAKEWRIPVGRIDGPNVALAKQVFRGERLSKIIDEVIKVSKKRGDGKWIIRANQGKIEVIRPGQNSPVYFFTAENVTNINDIQSAENLVTRVKIVGSASDDERRPVVAQVDGRTEFGILQEIIYSDQYDTESAAREAAKDILDERGKPEKIRRFESVDLPFLRRGDKVRVSAGTLIGYYLVKGISHNATRRTMTVEVEDV